MSATFLRGLSQDEQKQAMLRISQFVLRAPMGEIRESLYKRLLEIGIFLSNEKGKAEFRGILRVIKDNFFGIMLDS